MSNFDQEVQHLDMLKFKLKNAKTDKDLEAIKANIEVASKKCRALAELYQKAGYSNDRVLKRFESEISRVCK